MDYKTNDIIEYLKDVIEENVPRDRLAEIFDGSPENLYSRISGNKMYISLFLTNSNYSTENARLMKDDSVQTVAILVAINKLASVRDKSKGVYGFKYLRWLIEGRNDEGTEYRDDSLVGIIRRKFTLPKDDTTPRIENQRDVNIEYLPDFAPTNKTYEALITIDFKSELTVPDRL